MIGYIVALIAWSLLMIVLGLNIASKDYESRIENIKGSVAFHKDQKEMFVEQARAIV